MAVNENTARMIPSQMFVDETSRVERNIKRVSTPKFNMTSMWLCIGVSVATFWYMTNFGAQIDALNYSIDTTQNQIISQVAENASLITKVSQLEEPSRILRIAFASGDKYTEPVIIHSDTTR